jgi:coenzyme F420-0:L-glutamate ligase/coenzyme F420-1:gamma-L-glutamate ligase
MSDRAAAIEVGERIEAIALHGLPIVRAGDDLAALLGAALARAAITLRDGDVIVVASKLVSRSEGRFVALASIEPGPRARRLAAVTGHDAAHVEVILRESTAVSRATRGVLITRHRLGFVVANAGVDFSNVGVEGSVLLLPHDPDASAAHLAASLGCAIVISDSFGRPFRFGSVGVAIGASGLPALHDQRGRRDLFGRALEHTETALADQVAATADLVAGQADEARGAVLVRGLRFAATRSSAAVLVRPAGKDLYA